MFRFRYGIFYWILGAIVCTVALFGMIEWFKHYILTLANTPNQIQAISPIELAGVTATLGGLVLVGAFYKGKDEQASTEDAKTTADLKFIGKLILCSSVCFIVTYFTLEYVRTITSTSLSYYDWFFIVITGATALSAGITLSVALGLLVTIIRFL